MCAAKRTVNYCMVSPLCRLEALLLWYDDAKVSQTIECVNLWNNIFIPLPDTFADKIAGYFFATINSTLIFFLDLGK